MILPGIQYFDGPIPLGGTSNHFRTAALQTFHGWDPYNVTEDCDLGVRLALSGLQTKLLDSTTWEEANSKVGNWIRQRSRWVKGYLQTHLVSHAPLVQLGPKFGVEKRLYFSICVLALCHYSNYSTSFVGRSRFFIACCSRSIGSWEPTR